MKRDEIQVGKLPKNLLDKIGKVVRSYSVCLLAMYIENGEPRVELIGSGTLIKFGDKFGILTAYHVVHSNKFMKSERIGVGLNEEEHQYSIGKNELEILDIGIPIDQKRGPDLSIIVLYSKNLATMKSLKSFWPIDFFRDRRPNEQMLIDYGVCCLVGCPQVLEGESASGRHFEIAKSLFMIAGFSGISRIWDNGDFDFIEYPVSYDEVSDSPSSFGGVSGGGLWHVILKRSGSNDLEFEKPFMIGVAYYQTEIRNNIRYIYCNGIKSIYDRAFEALSDI